MVVWDFSSPQNMHLWLHWNCRPVWKPQDIYPIVRNKKWVYSVGESTSSFLWIKTPCEIILLHRVQHLWLLFKNQELMFVKRCVNDIEVRVCEFVQIDPMNSGTKVHFAFGAMRYRLYPDIFDC